MLSDKALAKYAALRHAYLMSLDKKRANLIECWQSVADSHWSSTALHNLRHALHQLAGSAAPYGLEAISRAASELEQLIIEYSEICAAKKTIANSRSRVAVCFNQLITLINAESVSTDRHA